MIKGIPQGRRHRGRGTSLHTRAWLPWAMAWLRAAAQGMGLFCCRASGRDPEDSARTRFKCSTMLGEGDVAPDSSCGH